MYALLGRSALNLMEYALRELDMGQCEFEYDIRHSMWDEIRGTGLDILDMDIDELESASMESKGDVMRADDRDGGGKGVETLRVRGNNVPAQVKRREETGMVRGGEHSS